VPTAPPGSREVALGFADARGCKEWLNALPLTNIPQAQTLLLEALGALDGATLEALERLKCLELMREKVAFLQGAQRTRYFGKTLPLSANDNSAWLTGRALLEAMEAGYRKVLEAAMGDGEARRHCALVAQRVVRCLGAQMLFHDIVYRRFDRQLWVRLHGQYRQAEASGWHRERVKDSLEGDESGSSIEEAYVQVVMLQAAYLAELRAHEIDFTEALLRQWIRKVQVAAEPPGEAGHALAVDLDRDIGARPLAQVEAGASRRVLDTAAISKSLRRRIKGLKEEESPAALGLPPLPADAIDTIETELLPARPDASARFEWSGAVIHRWRDLLHAGPARQPLPADWSADWSGEAPLALPTGDTLALEPPTRFDAPLRVHARQGGERLVLPGRSHHTELKHALQDLGVPPWERARLPLLSAQDGTLLAAADLVLSGQFTDWLPTHATRLRWLTQKMGSEHVSV